MFQMTLAAQKRHYDAKHDSLLTQLIMLVFDLDDWRRDKSRGVSRRAISEELESVELDDNRFSYININFVVFMIIWRREWAMVRTALWGVARAYLSVLHFEY